MRIGVSLYFCAHQRDGVAKSDFMTYPHDFALIQKISPRPKSGAGIDIEIYTEDYQNEYISLTDIAKYRNGDDPRFVIQNWMRNRNTIGRGYT